MGWLAVRDFVKHAHFGEREGALEQAFAQHANLAGVKAVEGADGVDSRQWPRSVCDKVNYILDYVI